MVKKDVQKKMMDFQHNLETQCLEKNIELNNRLIAKDLNLTGINDTAISLYRTGKFVAIHNYFITQGVEVAIV